MNRLSVEGTGENHALLHRGKLDGACARAQQLLAYGETRPDILDLAVALLFGIARSHAFEQGNKRTAFMAFVAFLEANGCELHLDDLEVYADEIIRVLDGEAQERNFRDMVAPHVESPSRHR